MVGVRFGGAKVVEDDEEASLNEHEVAVDALHRKIRHVVGIGKNRGGGGYARGEPCITKLDFVVFGVVFYREGSPGRAATCLTNAVDENGVVIGGFFFAGVAGVVGKKNAFGKEEEGAGVGVRVAERGFPFGVIGEEFPDAVSGGGPDLNARAVASGSDQSERQ